MIFSSPEFIFLLLPIAFLGYFFLNQIRLVVAGKIWLVVVSLFFYAYWNIVYLPLLLASIVFNFIVGIYLSPFSKIHSVLRYLLFIISISINLIGLAYFKYANFLIDNRAFINSSS